MNIFLVIPTIKQGGAERVISELANEFSRYSDLTVHLVLLANADDFYQLDERITVHRLGFKNTGHIGKLKSEVIVFLKMRTLLKRHNPTVVLSFMDKYNVFTILASRFLNIQVFVSDRSNPKLKLSSSMYILKKITYRYSTGIIAQTSLAKYTIAAFTGHKNVRVIPNPVKEINTFPEIKRENIIINVGRLVPEKGQEYLIKAFSMLGNKDWKLVILGDGPLHNKLKSQILDLGLDGKVIMPGAVKNIDEWLAKSSIFVLSSVSEGFPNALVEAMAAGLPCVSFDCDAGPRDIIINGVNGFLVEKENINELVDKLNTLITDTELASKLAKNASLVREQYHIQSIGNNYLNFLLKK